MHTSIQAGEQGVCVFCKEAEGKAPPQKHIPKKTPQEGESSIDDSGLSEFQLPVFNYVI